MTKGLLILISGPSGVGKGTVRKILMKDKSLNLAYSISMTTREKREDEKDGKDYFFVTKEYFEKQIEENKFLEHAYFVGHYYGTPKDYVENLRNKGKNVIVEVETRGARQIMSKVHEGKMISIFLNAPSFDELEKRIKGRQTEDKEVIQKRLNKAKSEIELKGLYDFEVINDDPNKAAEEIANIIKANI